MRGPVKARALFAGTVAIGAGVVLLAPFERSSAPIATLALLAAAVVLTELIQVSGDESSLDPADSQSFSFSSGVHLAAVLIIGPWTGAAIAALGVVVVDSVRGKLAQRICYNASVFAIAALAAGYVFRLLGGSPGSLDLPQDLPALGGLALVYYVANTALVNAMIAFHTSESVWILTRDALRSQLPTAAGEAGLGIAVAFFALREPWAILALIPLVVATYQAHARLATLRRETARALETFANVVDERDPYTYRHSARVADHVQALAEALDLPSSQVARLRWAGRLHDLGKIGVDTSLLNKPSDLDQDEWNVMRRHARLSARLLRRFRFASEEARAVEYHHERFDGRGYYGIEPGRIPLAAHFLVVADSFDAMTSDRPYRRALPKETALAEIERGAGTQFHPAVAKAFVALQRGLDPAEALSPEECAALGTLSSGQRKKLHPVVREFLRRPEIVVTSAFVLGLASVSLEVIPAAVAAFTVALCAAGWYRLENVRAGRLARSLRFALESAEPDRRFEQLVERMAAVGELRWAGLVAWRENELSAGLSREWNLGQGPTEAALSSWLIREAETEDLVIADGAELGREGAYLALPLRQDGSTLGYLVLASYGPFPRRVEMALGALGEDLVETLAPRRSVFRPSAPQLVEVA